jgi:hypothetical protein
VSQFDLKIVLMFVRFEQGRGVTGVPKTWVPYLVGHPRDATAKPAISTLVKMTVGMLRAQCADPTIGHGRDLMPGADDDYALHNLDGGRIEKVEDIAWETVDGINRAELVLTWKNPAELLPMPPGAEDQD